MSFTRSHLLATLAGTGHGCGAVGTNYGLGRLAVSFRNFYLAQLVCGHSDLVEPSHQWPRALSPDG